MKATYIPVTIKRTCCEMHKQGMNSREIYDEYFKDACESPMSYKSFRSCLARWRRKSFPDDTTLVCGTYEGFTAHNATVQVSKDGEIIQAWIKQKANEVDPEEFLQAIRQTIVPYEYEPKRFDNVSRMLEIPLFDMHWGVAYMDYYKPVLDEVLDLINLRHWDRIVIPFGQDFFHNDSIVKGETTKGTPIQKVDMMRAVKEGLQFMFTIIEAAIKSANDVKVIYSPGNHDASTSWMFMQTLLVRFGPSVVDDSFEYRKVIAYGKNSIMVTHGDSKQATAKSLAHIFPISFPEEFAHADVREVHSGHLHHEAEADIYGVMVRRLSSGGKVDDWTDKEDFVGTHRRFMIFEWNENKLKSIHYI